MIQAIVALGVPTLISAIIFIWHAIADKKDRKRTQARVVAFRRKSHS